MTLTLGIDEASRGPVIGPMIIAGVLLDKKKEESFKQIGVKDSKLLTHKKRCELAKFIKREADDYVVLIVDIKEIDAAVNAENKFYNLNWLEADKSVEIIKKLDPDVVILDCPSPTPQKYKDYVHQRIDKDIKLIVEHKADLNYISCAAASILAKCKREEIIDALKKKYARMGSGYPADPETKTFLKENWEKHPELFRKSWVSYKKHQTAKKQKKLGEF